ncbi:serine hydrolase FSH [Hypoxylon trugodes]|uniref:serine hydrolase FSH n=1 Tax=Hypoxylon trugodes TaxID=326681 RepID=UPI002195ECFF|nr:serine hydrolase FSH [Hypoxylon trugodes]KAI1383032.1 serine hydrolase FSH [Hypoxylon trugodes]
MKILCLHDDGENKEILQSELASLLPKLQDSNADLSFEFANGPLQDSNLSTNNSSLNESPRYRFYEAEEVKDIRKANKWLAKKLDDDGPYDGVLAFSQGAVLISSFLLYRQWYDHELSPAFKFAIFISGCIPLKVLKDLGVPVPKQAEDAVAQAKTQCAEGLGPLLDHTSKARRAVFNSDDCFGLNLNKIPLELKIRIPTVHVWGENSPMFPTSVQLAGLCDPYIRKIFIHPGKHEIPHGRQELMELASLIEWCIERGNWPGQIPQ